MNKLPILLCLFLFTGIVHGQIRDTISNNAEKEAAGDDPSQFFTRVEFINELQQHKTGTTYFNLNQTTFRTVVKIGKRFTTRLDIPFMYNSISSNTDMKQFGLSDISFRVLGYKFLESKKSAITASIEISLNTAESPLLGFGKNIILPVVTYTTSLKEGRILLACILQQANSFSGDENRSDISFTKIQPIFLKVWTRKVWTVLAPELYIDYIKGGATMNLEARITYAPIRRTNIWAQVGTGLFGDFPARYYWGGEVGGRYFFLRNTIFKRKKSS